MPLPNLLDPISGENPSGANLRRAHVSVYDKITEARRKEDPLDRNDLQRALKEADYPLVVRLATDALAKSTKDLQIAAWLTEALVYQQGLNGLVDGLDLIRGLIEKFWDTLYPEIEDGDAGMRTAPLAWLGEHRGMDFAVRSVRLTKGGFSWIRYKESRAIGYEATADTEVKIQARKNAIDEGKLTAEEFDADVSATPPAKFQEIIAGVDKALESVQLLNDLCREKFQYEDAPGFDVLRKALEDIQHTARILLNSIITDVQEPQDGDHSEEVEATDSTELTAASTSESVPASPQKTRKQNQTLLTEPTNTADAVQLIISAAAYLRRAEPFSPVPYLALRALRWGELRGPGGIAPEMLEAPDTEARQRLKKFIAEGQWEHLLEQTETVMGQPCGRGWLDLQRYSVRACTELGSDYMPIAHAIQSEIQTLLQDFPTLPSLMLLDDTPTANKETQDWLLELTAHREDEVPEFNRLPVEVDPESEELAPEHQEREPYDLAVEAAQSGETERAMQILSQEITRERSGRGRFLRRMQLAQICVYSNRYAIAYPILQDLAQEIDLRRLESWEHPETLAEMLGLLLRTMQKVGVTEEARSRVYAQICRLDPIHAARLAD
jgi:type VI secretion system protein ImpA